jgi:DNA replication licensing factor MCM4
MYNMNLDCEKLKNHPPALVLYHQLIRYPQEIIPLMDHCLNEIFLEKFQDAQIPVDQSIKVRPFNLGRNVNMRDLNPSGAFTLHRY